MDAGAFKSCLESDKHADLVTANMEFATHVTSDLVEMTFGITRA